MELTLEVTLAILAVAVVVVGFSNYMSRKPAEPGKVRWIPYVGVQFLGILVVVLMVAHLISLVTGQPLVGRMRR